MKTRFKKATLQFEIMEQVDVPQGRNGKHKQIVSLILNDLNQLKDGGAIKVPLAELGETKEKVRSALNRATRKEGRKVATATDERYLYIWNLSK
jgi:DNA helicase TIP49 (TBP-interacting protein)